MKPKSGSACSSRNPAKCPPSVFNRGQYRIEIFEPFELLVVNPPPSVRIFSGDATPSSRSIRRPRPTATRASRLQRVKCSTSSVGYPPSSDPYSCPSVVKTDSIFLRLLRLFAANPPSSAVLRPPSSVLRPPSSALRPPPSVLRRQSSVIRHTPSAQSRGAAYTRPSSAVRCPPSPPSDSCAFCASSRPTSALSSLRFLLFNPAVSVRIRVHPWSKPDRSISRHQATSTSGCRRAMSKSRSAAPVGWRRPRSQLAAVTVGMFIMAAKTG